MYRNLSNLMIPTPIFQFLTLSIRVMHTELDIYFYLLRYDICQVMVDIFFLQSTQHM